MRLDVWLCSTREQEVVWRCPAILLDAAEYEIKEAISDFDRALVQCIDDHIAFLNGIILIQKLEERACKGLEIGMTTAVVAGLEELPDNSRKLLALLTKLPDQTSENGIELLEFRVVEVEVVIGETGVGLRLAELLEVIDDGRAYDCLRTESGRGTRDKRQPSGHIPVLLALGIP